MEAELEEEGVTAREEKPLFDDETGVALNEVSYHMEARRLVEEATAKESSPHAVITENIDERPTEVLSKVHTAQVAEGKWKYVQVRLEAPDGGVKIVVRSYKGYKFHAEMFKVLMKPLKKQGVQGFVVGGGRIIRDTKAMTMSVFGYSKTFGRAPGCNEASSGIIREAFPGYAIDWSDEGY